MNKFDFYFPSVGFIDDTQITIKPYEFNNFITHYICPLNAGGGLPMIFWTEVQYIDGTRYYHLTIVCSNTFYPNDLNILIEAIRLYTQEFQTGPIMWNDQMNHGILTKENE